MKQITYTLNDVDVVAKALLCDLKNYKVVTFTGGLGAGKTTLIQALVAAMGSVDRVTSPTFTYFNVYHLPKVEACGQNGAVKNDKAVESVGLIYHFDLYRLNSLQDFEAAGFFEYLYQSDSVAFIEWPDILNSVLNHNVCHIELQVVSADMRLLTYSCTK